MSPAVPRWVDAALRAAAIVLGLGLGGLGLALPGSILLGGVAWLGFLFFACSGAGYLLVRAARVDDPDLGLRATWGIAGLLALGGALLAVGAADRAALLALLGAGALGGIWRAWVTPLPAWRLLPRAWAAARVHPAVAISITALVAAALFRMIGGVASLERNVYDDDVGYLPLLRRLLDLGELTEPFSFRRLGSYGGQLLLQGLGAARGSFVNFHLIDKALCFGLASLLLVGHARTLLPAGGERAAGVRALPLALVMLLLLTLPDVGVNTASHWSGVVCFLALVRTMAAADRLAAEAAEAAEAAGSRRWLGMLALAALLGAAACTLRQNYLAVVACFFAFALLSRLRTAAAGAGAGWAAAWRRERAAWAVIAGVALAALLPWWIAAYTSNQTFLFPFMQGTWNHGFTLKPSALTAMQELEFLALAALEPEPLSIVTPLALLLLFVRDRRASRPLTALFFATAASFLLLVHAFVGSDLASLWRYAFGSGMALTALLVLEACHLDEPAPERAAAARPVQLLALGRWALLAAVILQLFLARGRAPKTYATFARAIAEAASSQRRGDPVATAERVRYRAMQAAIPAGAPVAVMLDDAAYLDYRRNPIANLDTPGYCSPGAPGQQLPSFAGAEAVQRYFAARGYRYLAFVRPDFSRYFYRRWYWLRELYTDLELFQVMAAYTLDAIESFTALAERVPVLHDRDGLVVLDLGPPGAPPPPRPLEGEAHRRGQWVRQLSERLGLRAAWALNTREGLVFADGFGGVVFSDGVSRDEDLLPPLLQEPAVRKPDSAATGAPAAADAHATVPGGTPLRWLHRRAHLRLQSERPMRLTLRGQVRRELTGTRPRLVLSLDGDLLASQVVDEDGRFAVELAIPAARLAEWADLYLVFSSVGVPERDSKDLRFARLDGVEWEAQ